MTVCVGFSAPEHVLQVTITLVLPAQCASSLGVVFVVVQSQQQLSQIRVYLMVPNARQNFEQEG